jgi:hypothetical protein
LHRPAVKPLAHLCWRLRQCRRRLYHTRNNGTQEGPFEDEGAEWA